MDRDEGNNGSEIEVDLGPHGVGDPNDVSLRVAERKVLIPQFMREKLVATHCRKVAVEYFKCIEESGLLIVPKCNKPRTAFGDCMRKWFDDENFQAEVTRDYLAYRSHYRRTGKPAVNRSHRPMAGSAV